jgi:DNA-binding SARP family transcriptional activator
MSLSLSLLGVFQASLNGEPVTEFYSSKVRALLAYLAVEAGREHPRPVLAALLWPDWDDRAALGNLRFSLSKLRQAIHDQNAVPPFLLIDRDTIQLNPSAEVSVDVHLFQQELRASRWESADDDGRLKPAVRSAVEHLRTAMDLYRGPFLEGFAVGDSAVFEQWVLIQREQLEREARWALHGLTALYYRLGDCATAERTVRQLLEMDPWDELANRRLMAVLLRGAQRNAALRHYTAYQEDLARELGCEPEEETQALYAQIRDGTLPQPSPLPATRSVSASPALPPQNAAVQPPPPFVAREQELARLRSLLDRALAAQPGPGQPVGSGGGVALIAGEAGSGKTGLLDEFARQASEVHGDLIVLRGSCNAQAGAGDPYLPFREMLQTLAGDVGGKRAGGTLSPKQARRAWESLPAFGAALVEHGPDLIDRLVPGEALLRRAEGLPGPPGIGRPLGHYPSGQVWQARLREIVRHGQAGSSPGPGAELGVATPEPDLFAQVTQVLHAVAVGSPLLLAIDDLQWADGGTAALLFHLGRRLAGSRILLVCAYRPEALDPQTAWGTSAGDGSQAAAPGPQSGLGAGIGAVLQELTRVWGDVLVDLDQADGRAFIEAYVDSEPNCLGAAFRQALYDHTAGNPLFSVELLRSFEREGTLVQDEAGRWVQSPGLDWERWPSRVEAVIAGRLATLSDEDRALLQAASVQGEQFAAEVVARVLACSEEAVVRRLSGPLTTRHRLVHAVSLDRLASNGQRLSRYRFRHALVQGSAYRSLDEVGRARLHEATGRALEAFYAPVSGQPAEERLPELAQHFEAAGLSLEAARYRLGAGRWAVRLVAYDEAIGHLERGLALLDGVAASPERLRLELSLCLALAIPAMLRRGWQAPAYTRTLGRLSELTQHPDLRDDPQRLTALTVLAQTITWSADPERGLRVGDQLLGLIHDGNRGDLQSLMPAHWVLGLSQCLRGQLVAARGHLSQALALYDREAGRHLDPLFGGDPGVTVRTMLGFTLWLLGNPDQGRDSLRQALARAEEIEQPSSVAFAHLVAGMVYFILGRDVATALNHAGALRGLDQAGLVFGAWAELLAGQAGAAGGPKPGLEQGLARAAEATSALDAVGAGVGQVGQLLVQAQMLVRAGQAEMAMETLDQALAWIERTGVRVMEAEVWRVRGELLLTADDGQRTMDEGQSTANDRHTGSSVVGRALRSSSAEVEACFHRALAVAREQQARWLELRAAVSLARLWQGQGRHDEARELLSDIYGWFTEGFDTVDLVEAKALLEELE